MSDNLQQLAEQLLPAVQSSARECLCAALQADIPSPLNQCSRCVAVGRILSALRAVERETLLQAADWLETIDDERAAHWLRARAAGVSTPEGETKCR